MLQGLVHVYTGDGKGKSTCALGLAFRAIGHGKRVKLIRFVKGGFSGELATIGLLSPRMEYEQINPYEKLIFHLNKEEEEHLIQLTRASFTRLSDSVRNGEFDLYILDEIFAALNRRHLEPEMVLELIADRAENVELILTGRNAPAELRKAADYVTVMQKEAHPLDEGVTSRPGIEY